MVTLHRRAGNKALPTDEEMTEMCGRCIAQLAAAIHAIGDRASRAGRMQ
jgi:predicted amidohydrolase YtcJ